MPKLNISQLQQAAPAQVNAPLKVPTDDGSAALGQALVNAGNQFGKIGAQIAQQQITADVAEAETSALIGLSTLKTRLAKEGTASVMSNFDVEAELLKETLLENMSPGARQKFIPSFNRSYAQSRIGAMSDGLKVDHQRSIAKGEEALDALSRGQVGKEDLDFKEAKNIGTKLVQGLVSTGARDAVKGQKMRTKFLDETAKNHVLGHIGKNAIDIAQLRLVQKELASEQFSDPELQRSYNRLSETEQFSVRSRLRREMSDLLAIEKVAAKTDDDNEQKQANSIKIEHNELLGQPPSADRTKNLLANLNKLKALFAINEEGITSRAELSTMEGHIREGRAPGQHDPDVYRKAATRARLGTLPPSELLKIEKGLTPKDRATLTQMNNSGETGAMQDAQEFLNTHPAFVPTGGRLQKDQITRDQAVILNRLKIMEMEAIDAGTAFNARKEARELMRDYVANQEPTVRDGNARALLREHSITKMEHVEPYIRANKDGPNAISTDTMDRIRGAAQLILRSQ